MTEAARAEALPLVVAVPLGIERVALRRGGLAAPVLRSGFGPARARRTASELAEHPARRVAVAGLCGAVDPSLDPGDVVVASELISEGGRSREVDPAGMCEALAHLGIPTRAGPVVSVPQIVRGRERGLLHRRGAIAVDMESAWLAQGAAGRPLAVLRVVLDGPRHELLRPRFARQAVQALRMLSRVAPALQMWADEAPLESEPAVREPGGAPGPGEDGRSSAAHALRAGG